MNTYEGKLLNKMYMCKKKRIEILNKEELQKREDKDTYR